MTHATRRSFLNAVASVGSWAVAKTPRPAAARRGAGGFGHHRGEPQKRGAEVCGFTPQTANYQKEMVPRLHVPFEVLSDPDLAFVHALRLPTFEVAGMTLVKRLTLVISRGHIEKVFYPVFPPDKHAAEVMEWLRSHPSAGD